MLWMIWYDCFHMFEWFFIYVWYMMALQIDLCLCAKCMLYMLSSSDGDILYDFHLRMGVRLYAFVFGQWPLVVALLRVWPPSGDDSTFGLIARVAGRVRRWGGWFLLRSRWCTHGLPLRGAWVFVRLGGMLGGRSTRRGRHRIHLRWS